MSRRRSAVMVVVLALLAFPVAARTVTDSAGRLVEIPDSVSRVFAAGPPASTLLYVVAPEKMIGWVRPPRDDEKPFLLPQARSLPELGRLTGRGDTLNLEKLIADKPDLIVDFGTVNDTYRSLADRLQQQTGIPYLLIDGRFSATPAALRLLGGILGVAARGEELARAAEAIFAGVDHVLAEVPPTKRPHVYLARGPEGLESGSQGSITTEIIERAGGINVAEGLRARGGLVDVSAEQVIAWAPDTILAEDRHFAATVRGNAAWQPVPAVAHGRIFLAPSLPFGFIDSPPSVNRLIGLTWVLHVLYPDRVQGDLREEVKNFYHLFYQVDVTESDLTRLLAGSTN